MTSKVTSKLTLEDADSKSSTTQATGRLVPLKTTLEISAREAVANVYIAAVFPPQKASTALSLAAKLLPNDGGLNLQHLSRFAKYAELPVATRASIAATEAPGSPFLENSARYFIVGSTDAAITEQELKDALAAVLDTARVYRIPVPRLAPTSQEQANLWTTKYWRTTYNKNHSFGPHPHLLLKAEEEIRGDAGEWMGLAAEVAREASTTGSGERIGVVIVERRDGVGRVVATAGDARWLDWPRVGAGNATAHAVLRGICMIAQGLKSRDEAEGNNETMTEDEDEGSPFKDKPLGAIEKEHCRPPEGNDGYLCHNLEIYCTHEPCVMCSMAIVHSRFGKVVFGRRMPRTGGMCADGDLGHGLFWRKELNWTLHAWHWESDVLDSHVEDFDGNA